MLALSLFGGIGLGFGLGMLRDLMDRVFRTAKQLEEELQVPCVALVPLVKHGKTTQPWHETISGHIATNHNAVTKDFKVYRTVIDAPLSSFAEAIRSIKLAIDLHMEARPCKVIGFTSTLPNEGKSTIAAALAHLIGQVGGRVLLVDCDLRNPTLTRMLSQQTAIGVFDVVSKKASVTEAILKDTEIQHGIFAGGKKNTFVSHE